MGKFPVKDNPAAAAASMRNEEKGKATGSDDPRMDGAFTSDIPPDIIFPDQLNKYFREQIHSLTLENGALRRSLEETQEELLAMKEKLSKATQPVPAGRVAEMADYKIAQLSKRLREQNAEMEKLRTQTREAEAKLRHVQDRVAAEREREEGIAVAAAATAAPNELADKDRQIKALGDKLQAANARMCEFRNQYQAVKQELRLAQKVIECEVGDKCSLQDLARESGNWRGRAQQILALQNKVQALQEQLSNGANATDNPASSVLRQIERERRASYEETSKQLNQKTIQMEDLRKKFEAARARCKVLESEIIQLKAKLSAVAEKGARDEQLLSALTNQINMFEDRGKAQMHCFSKMQESTSKLQKELDLERTKGEQLQRALSDREARIHRMEQQIEELRRNLKNKVHEEMFDADNEDGNARTTADKSTETMDSFKASNVADTERRRLLELLGVVNRRLDEAREEQNETESQLRKERYKNAKLETKVARLELEKVGAMKTGRGSYTQGLNKVGDSVNLDQADILARQHIEYLEEECLALKTRIETLQMERDADLKVLASIGGAAWDAASDGHHRPRARMDSTPVSSERVFPVRPGHGTRVKLSRRTVHRSPANTIRSTSLRQSSSMLSEDFRHSDQSPDRHRLVSHQ